MSVATRQLGANGPQVTAIGFGLMGMSAFYGKADLDEERFKFLDYIYSKGERFWDTSDSYGDSEDLLGRWFERNPEKRQDIVLATKFGNMSNGVARNDAAYVREACERSLKRLHTDYIDLYYVHRVDSATPIELTVRAMVELKKEGKIHHLGLSEVSAATLRRAQAVHPIAAVEMEYSPFSLEIESPDTQLLATCRELGVAVVAYSPLGRGMLTGRYQSPDDLDEDDWRRNVPRFSAENFPKNLELVRQLQDVATRKGCSSGQLVLAWLLAQWDMIIPIPGTKRTKYFDENMGALEVQLTEDEEREIRKAIDSVAIQGDRYPVTGWASTLFADTAPLQE